MASEELQVTLKARDELSDEVKRSIKNVAKLEAALKEASNATSPEAARDVDKLGRQLTDAYGETKKLSGAVENLDRRIDRLGGSATNTGRDLDRMNRHTGSGTTAMASFGKTLGKGNIALLAATAAAVGFGLAVKRAAELTINASVAAVEYEKKVRRTDVVFRGQAKRVRRWADANNEAFGASVEDVAGYLASIGDILKPLGFATKDASKLALATGDLIPALTEWNTKGMDAEAVTLALTNALTGEREMLKSLGIVIKEEDVKLRMKQMKGSKELKGLTEKQAKAVVTLKLATEGSADALDSYNSSAGTAGRSLNAIRAGVADVKDAGLDIVAETIRELGKALSGSADSPVPGVLKWIKKNHKALVSGLLGVAGTMLRVGEFSLRMASMWLKSMGYMLDALDPVFSTMAMMPGPVGDMGRSLKGSGDKALRAADSLNVAATSAAKLADSAFEARDRVALMSKVLKDVKGKKVRLVVETVVQGFQGLGVGSPVDDPTGDTSVGKGVGSMGVGGLRAAHEGYSASLGGHSITSAVRSHNLGSAYSDHRMGRAMDVTGPRLGAYAQAVRRSGGYASVHGSGASRHLHVVPQTRRPGPSVSAGGNSFTANVTVNNPHSPMDVQAAVYAGLRQAARKQSERG